MADTFSDLLGLRKQQTGGNNNTWGDLLNSDVFEVLEDGIAGMTTRAVTGGSLDLSAAPVVAHAQKFTGVLASNQTVILPNLSKSYKIWNATSGAFAMLVKTTSGTAICIPQGTVKDVFCDGANTMLRADRAQVGEIFYHGGGSVPAGAFECNGATPLRADVPDLFAVCSTTWGSGNGTTTFTLPDFYTAGRYLRSRTASLAIGTTQADTVGPHGHLATGSTSVSLTIANDLVTVSGTTSTESADHTHDTKATSPAVSVATGVGNLVPTYSAGQASGGKSATHTHTWSANSSNHNHGGSSASASTSVTVANNTGTTETRPVSAVAICCIRY